MSQAVLKYCGRKILLCCRSIIDSNSQRKKKKKYFCVANQKIWNTYPKAFSAHLYMTKPWNSFLSLARSLNLIKVRNDMRKLSSKTFLSRNLSFEFCFCTTDKQNNFFLKPLNSNPSHRKVAKRRCL